MLTDHVLMLHCYETQDRYGGENEENSGTPYWIADPDVWTITGERLDPSALGRKIEEEQRRFEAMRSQTENDSDDIKVDAKWVVTQKETPSALSFKASLVACEFAARKAG